MDRKYDPYFGIKHEICGSIVEVKISELMELLKSTNQNKKIICPACPGENLLLEEQLEYLGRLVNKLQEKGCTFWIGEIENP